MITIQLDETSREAKALLNYLRTLGFVRIQEIESKIDWLDGVSESEKKILEERISLSDNKETTLYTWSEVEKGINEILSSNPDE
ncbi:MAG: hypothetical protein KAI79_09165 [Bacteroidales bacterium]|nr:hypothetical protein [Bacteroidales bacterium]